MECANYTCLKGIENVTWMPSGQLLAVIGFNEMVYNFIYLDELNCTFILLQTFIVIFQ